MSRVLVPLQLIIGFALAIFLPDLMPAGTKIDSSLILMATLVIAVSTYIIDGVNIPNEWVRRPIKRLGIVIRIMGPGLHWVEPFLNRPMRDVPVRDLITQLRMDNVMTKDNVQVSFIAVMTTRISEGDVKKVIIEVEDVYGAVQQRGMSTINETVGVNTLDRFLSERTQLGDSIQDALTKKVAPWGVQVKAVEIRDFKISDDKIGQSIAMRARALKEAEGELERAKLQKEINVMLDVAAGSLNEGGWALKKMELILEMARSANNNTVYFYPTDVFDALKKLISGDGKSPDVAPRQI